MTSPELLREIRRSLGQLTREKDLVWRGGVLLATVGAEEGITHVHVDHLGSTRLLTDRCGQAVATFDLYPFGKTLGDSPQHPQRMRFTGHERDLNARNDDTDDFDYMHARYYKHQWARFVSADQARGTQAMPQTWNMFAYAANNPLRLVDTTGRDFSDFLQVISDTAIGYAKEAANTVIGLANIANRVTDSTIEPFTTYRFGQIEELAPSNEVQQSAMHAMFIASLAATAGQSGEARVAPKLVSSIGKDKALVRLAEEAGATVQKGIDHLTAQLSKGNLNPGIGTKKLSGDISYARARDGARVFFRKLGDTIEILAKASKKNEAQVIRRVEELYRP